MFGALLYTVLLMAAAFGVFGREMYGAGISERAQVTAAPQFDTALLRPARLHWPLPEDAVGETDRGLLFAVGPVVALGRSDSGRWLWAVQKRGRDGPVFEGWARAALVDLESEDVNELVITLDRGIWLLAAPDWSEPVKLTPTADWNSWQWDPSGDAIWFHQPLNDRRDDGTRLSRFSVSAQGEQPVGFELRGDVRAAPVGGAVLVRVRNQDIWPLGEVYILDHDGAAHHIGRQCDVYFTDSYVPIGRDAAWSPDGRYVVLRDSAEPNDEGRCFIDGMTIYDRNGPVERDLTDRNSPYRQAWYRNPNFGDQVGTDHVCADRPPGVALSERRNRCQWSPDRQWFATMPGAGDNPWLADLLIYRADGTLVHRYLIIGWPCNTFQWSPDSQWLAYGGPSGCA